MVWGLGIAVGLEKEPAMKRAFTLVEMLVVVGVIGILISILLPVVLRSKRHAEAAAGTANLRSLSQVMSMYTTSNQDGFLNPFGSSAQGIGFAVSPKDPELEWDFTSINPEETTEGFAYYWYSYLAELDGESRSREEQYSPADAWMKTLRKRFSRKEQIQGGATLWPGSFLYSPTFWSDSSRYPLGREPATASTIFTQYEQSVGFPSQKVILFERADFEQRQRIEPDGSKTGRIGRPPGWNNIRSDTAVATVDGSVREIKMLELYAASGDMIRPGGLITAWDRPGLVVPFGSDLETGAAGGADAPGPAFFWATVHGIEGRDIPN